MQRWLAGIAAAVFCDVPVSVAASLSADLAGRARDLRHRAERDLGLPDGSPPWLRLALRGEWGSCGRDRQYAFENTWFGHGRAAVRSG